MVMVRVTYYIHSAGKGKLFSRNNFTVLTPPPPLVFLSENGYRFNVFHKSCCGVRMTGRTCCASILSVRRRWAACSCRPTCLPTRRQWSTICPSSSPAPPSFRFLRPHPPDKTVTTYVTWRKETRHTSVQIVLGDQSYVVKMYLYVLQSVPVSPRRPIHIWLLTWCFWIT